MINELKNLKKELDYRELEFMLISLENKINEHLKYDGVDYINNIDDFIHELIYEQPEYSRNYETGKNYSYALDRELRDGEIYHLEHIAAEVGFEYIKAENPDISNVEFSDVVDTGYQQENYNFYLHNESEIKYNIILEGVIKLYEENNQELEIDITEVDYLIEDTIRDDHKMYNNDVKDIANEILEEVISMSKEYDDNSHLLPYSIG